MRAVIFALASFFAPLVLLAASGDFYTLVSIPNINIDASSGTTLPKYINAVFTLVISVAAMLAVLRIVTGGFKYMTSEAAGSKGDAKEIIQGAVFGLILLLGSWLILNTVNPQILNLSALRFERLQTSGDAKKVLDEYNRKRDAYQAQLEEKGQQLLSGGTVLIDENAYGNERRDLGAVCKNGGGSFKTRQEYRCRNINGTETDWSGGQRCEFRGGQNTSFYSTIDERQMATCRM